LIRLRDKHCFKRPTTFWSTFHHPSFSNIKRSRHSGVEMGFSPLLFKGLAQVEDVLRLHGAYPFSCFVFVTYLAVAL
jgi:hypothetical protein